MRLDERSGEGDLVGACHHVISYVDQLDMPGLAGCEGSSYPRVGPFIPIGGGEYACERVCCGIGMRIEGADAAEVRGVQIQGLARSVGNVHVDDDERIAVADGPIGCYLPAVRVPWVCVHVTDIAGEGGSSCILRGVVAVG